MKALTVRQPHAQLIALGVKTIETRTKPTKYRGPLLIHAGAAVPLSGIQYGVFEVPGLHTFYNGVALPKMVRLTDYADIPLPLGTIVASCKLVDCVPIVGSEDDDVPDDTGSVQLTEDILMLWGKLEVEGAEDVYGPSSSDRDFRVIDDQRPYGDFTPGRFAWLLKDIKPVEQRCPACWVNPDLEGVCLSCDGHGHLSPIPAKGKQGLWNWEP